MHRAPMTNARTSRHARTNAVLNAARSPGGRANLVAAAVTGLLVLGAVGAPTAMAAQPVFPSAGAAPVDSAQAEAQGKALAALVTSSAAAAAADSSDAAHQAVAAAKAAAAQAAVKPAVAKAAAKPVVKAVAKPAAKPNGWVAPTTHGASISERYGLPNSEYAAGYHTGTDFAVNTGTPVLAIGPGSVVSAGWQSGYGNAVVIKLSDGRYVLYGHLSAFKVHAGERVTGGERVALSGDTGNSTGPHLHFEVRTSNVYGADIDPLAYLRSHHVSNY